MARFRNFMIVAALALIGLGLASSPGQTSVQDGIQLYLVEFTATDEGAPSTREQAIHLLDQLVVPSLERLARDERIRAGGLFVGARSGTFLMRARSHDEVTEFVRALPAWGVWGWRVMPIESFSHRADLERGVIKMLQGQGR